VPVAAIVIEPGVVVTAGQLREHCASRLANFKVPREFFRADTIPRTHATNRIQRSRLQTDISAGRMTHVA
jgi:acyl-CoA synthetase (AMP-forming)/AMP-acid ligase II